MGTGGTHADVLGATDGFGILQDGQGEIHIRDRKANGIGIGFGFKVNRTITVAVGGVGAARTDKHTGVFGSDLQQRRRGDAATSGELHILQHLPLLEGESSSERDVGADLQGGIVDRCSENLGFSFEDDTVIPENVQVVICIIDC